MTLTQGLVVQLRDVCAEVKGVAAGAEDIAAELILE